MKRYLGRFIVLLGLIGLGISCSVSHELEVTIFISGNDPTVKQMYFQSGNVGLFTLYDPLTLGLMYSIEFNPEDNTRFTNQGIPIGTYIPEITIYAANNLSQPILVGRLLADPYTQLTPNGNAVTINEGELISLNFEVGYP